MTLYNFSPGPAVLPEVVLEKSRQLVCEKHPVPLLEIGHRTAYMDEVVQDMQHKLRKLLDIPDDYEILFSSNGTRAQYAALVMNLADDKHVDYFNTGYWSEYAIAEAKKYIPDTKLKIVTSISEQAPLSLVAFESWQLSDAAAYRHYVSNETLTGFEFFAETHISDDSLVADMTSNFLTRTMDIRSHRMIYAGAQKNAGVGGLVYIIIAREALSSPCHRLTPALYDYNKLYETDSRPTTPSVFSWLVANLMLEWIEQQGGVAEMQKRCLQRSALIYDCIDSSSVYTNPVSKQYRSRVNILFNLATSALEQKFITEAEEQGLWGLKGHSHTGGIRASLYNGMPISGAETLVEFMKDFERKI